MRTTRCLLFTTAVWLGATPPSSAASEDVEAFARELIARGVAAERALAADEARAWYRAAFACYRYVVLPVRLARLDVLHESGILLPVDVPELARDGNPDFAPVVEDYLEAREEVERHHEEQARAALNRARILESRADVRSPGLVPLEPAGPRLAFEAFLDGVAERGAWELVLRDRYLDLERLDERPNGTRELATIIRRWESEGRHADIAERAELAARLIGETAVAFHRAALESLEAGIAEEARGHHAERIAAYEEKLAVEADTAARHYLAAAEALEAEGRGFAAAVYRVRASALRRPSDATPPEPGAERPDRLVPAAPAPTSARLPGEAGDTAGE